MCFSGLSGDYFTQGCNIIPKLEDSYSCMVTAGYSQSTPYSRTNSAPERMDNVSSRVIMSGENLSRFQPHLPPKKVISRSPSSAASTHSDSSMERSRVAYPCKHCGKVFSANFHLQMHIRKHTGDKPFVCEQCGRAFSQKGSLKRHTVMHLLQKHQ